MAIEPRAVTIQDSSEIAPTLAMFVGSIMMPEPIMFTATMNVSCIRFIFFCSIGALLKVLSRLFANDVGVKLDATVYSFLEHTLHLITEPGKPVERLLKGGWQFNVARDH